ncbi:MAG: carbohydrate porin [Bacteroidetes bacterium]|nr:carbohydrate porin [Bacteroidota bacterium]MBS1973108.1 carbohydrate porin [Bacteroidota bacterium]
MCKSPSIYLSVILCWAHLFASAQKKENFIQDSSYTCHFQLTVIGQAHSGFKAAYSGQNSLSNSAESGETSITSTLFLGRRLWKGAAFYFDPEISGGAGLSYSLGVAGALNGETYRIGNPSPVASIARAYIQQHIPLAGTAYETEDDDVNEVLDKKAPVRRITITVGKFSMSDFFDNNTYSHDPRTQFMNWSIMSNGAWDYPANTKGYTEGIVAELAEATWSFRMSSVAVPVIANQSAMEYVFGKAHSETAEFEKHFKLHNRPGAIRLLLSHTASRAPSYQQGIVALQNNDTTLLQVISGNAKGKNFGGSKTAICLDIEQEVTNGLSFFARAGWNDGKHASWAFTEIDQTVHAGFSLKGAKWGRKHDVIGLAAVLNGISSDHRNFLKQGGYGFIIGDGSLNYGNEMIIELYYNARLFNSFWLGLDYQFVKNPGYNKDRSGPVHVFGLRGHVEL